MSHPPDQRTRVARLVIFDLDGTLTETNEVDTECFLAAVQDEFGFTPASDWNSYEHCTDEGIILESFSTCFGCLPRPAQLDRLKLRFAMLLRTAAATKPELFAPVPGAHDLLRHLSQAGWHVRIATGAWRISAEIKIEAAGLPETIPLFTSDGLPSREFIVTAAMTHARESAGTSFGRIVAVGDGAWDVAAARRLALPFLGVARGPRAERLVQAGARAVVPDFTDVQTTLRQLEQAPVPVQPELEIPRTPRPHRAAASPPGGRTSPQ